MLITPRTYYLAQHSNQRNSSDDRQYPARFHSLTGWHTTDGADAHRARKMLLVHQSGYVRVGEAVRYTLTYTPSSDQILPTPAELHLRIKNTSAIPLRAAYLHGPYTLYTSCYPSNFNPDHQYQDADVRGVPQFEPNLKAGGVWTASIPIPESIRVITPSGPRLQSVGENNVTWVIEIVSQVIFSSSAAVHYEFLVSRDRKSLDLGVSSSPSLTGLPPPTHMHELQDPKTRDGFASITVSKGVFSKSVSLVFDDIRSLWNKPGFPSIEEKERQAYGTTASDTQPPKSSKPTRNPTNDAGSTGDKQKRRRVHFVVLTHGLHSNLGADMLFLKESIDAASKAKRESERRKQSSNDHSSLKNAGEGNGEIEDEEVIVRGFSGNAVRTERGIQYLGKRLAKYVLLMTYPDQPYVPKKKKARKNSSSPFSKLKSPSEPSKGETGQDLSHEDRDSEYQITSISFIGHSLGGLIQTYAIAYIQKHSPEFFDHIKPVNFIALASPFLGLSNENPIYVRFALDFGLVGRTGQDLGLSWTAPKVRNGWGAVIGRFGGDARHSPERVTPASKPLLRILPAGPAHQVLQRFRNRTIYSNVVNDGIVPLRTSCLLFLDWRGLDRVEKARRENGLVGTMAEWGWAELTGANSSSPVGNRFNTENPLVQIPREDVKENSTPELRDPGASPPRSPIPGQFFKQPLQSEPGEILPVESHHIPKDHGVSSPNPFSHLLSIFQSSSTKGSSSKKSTKILKRSQTLGSPSISSNSSAFSSTSPHPIVRGNSIYEEELNAPPRTTIFESAGDVLRPPLPPTEFILNPAARPRTIFHDRIYHPDDIPPPISKRRGTPFSGVRRATAESAKSPSNPTESVSTSGLKVEEKIARAYHHEISWRKVLVRLEPDAHNNIIVRRMFANAYGWPVVKHLVDTHFGDTYAANTDDALESNMENAKPLNIRATDTGEEVVGQTSSSPQTPRSVDRLARGQTPVPPDSNADARQRTSGYDIDEFHAHREFPGSGGRSRHSSVSRSESAQWTDRYFSEDDSGFDTENEREGRST
ncbi:putative serine esterase-domain-containing protein [Talaromyces proteolyticus]|uniref:Serine esterase-domain-containing protein n=1 Tax=Talaromyces proteolyticus TaxID=1131652 RepID=A0AAD4KE40_9EURO|nr:putative serine esterase-domain-containing protein [Talaromyces proteolyticus]KAH8689793.1 putative serine esterase-domain-containing protein [Talaromyces proteolyticus]